MPPADYGDFWIRLSRSDDFQAIQKLELSCSQGGDLKFCFQTEKPRTAKFDRAFALVAELKSDGAIVGTIAANIKRVQFEPGRCQTVSWIFGLRVAPEHRRSKIAYHLVAETERLLAEEGVAFVYVAHWIGNTPCCRLLQKTGYEPMVTVPLQGVNVNSVFSQLPADSFWQTNGIETSKLSLEDSAAFMSKHFSNSFFYPDESVNPLKCHVYLAKKKNSSDLAAFAMAPVADVWSFESVSPKLRIHSSIMEFCHRLNRRRFEKPLSLHNGWNIYWAIPFVYSKKTTNLETLSLLTKACMARAVKDTKGVADIIGVSISKAIGNIEEEALKTVKESLYLSPTIFKNGGIEFHAKCILTDIQTAASTEQFAKKQPFWFFDAKEL